MGSHTNSQLTKDLDRNSSSLSQILKSFVQHGQRIKVVSFVETEKMDWLNCLVCADATSLFQFPPGDSFASLTVSTYSQVVDQNSATLGWPGEIVVPIDANHRNICRFTGEKDHRIAPVLSNIKQIFREIRVNYLSNVQIRRKNVNV